MHRNHLAGDTRSELNEEKSGYQRLKSIEFYRVFAANN